MTDKSLLNKARNGTRLTSRHKLTTLQVFFIILGMVLLSRMLFMREMFYNVDEAYYAISARSWLNGLVPKIDVWGTNKPPGIELIYILAFKLFGESLLALHIACSAFILLITLTTYAVCDQLFGNKAALISAILLPVVMCCSFAPGALMAFNTEIPQMLFVLLGVYMFVLGLKGKFLLRLFLAGILSIFAVLIRQNALVHFAALFFYLLFFAGPQLNVKKRINGCLIMAAGAAAGLLPIILYYAKLNGLNELWYHSIVFPLMYGGDLNLLRILNKSVTKISSFAFNTLPATALALTFVLTRQNKTGNSRAKVFISIWFLFSAYSVSLGWRFFGHYFVQVMPALCILAGAGGAVLWEEGKNIAVVRKFLVVIIAVYFTVGLSIYNIEAVKTIYGKVTVTPFSLTSGELEKVVGKYIQENTTPSDKIFVWGLCPQIYWYSNRLPAVKDYACEFTTGYSPGAFNFRTEKSPRSSHIENAEKIMYNDLVKNKPEFIVDISPVRNYLFTFKLYPVSNYPLIASFINDGYKQVKNIGGVVIYRRGSGIQESDNPKLFKRR